ncbi:nickel pincer cofactor biosynthesis protein LarB [Stratiformator vulcanicus]|uniref:N5-carboxyaminoimidazole ribonucleotide mutase n=1 Tax=Stratiformator vulcanicus TaxID=2527980 RepID=A0A517R043_9PLAN|nr:nickel pincer cofactor biosynthesis protein LarB [Stratiformator vulcanicus]QDT37203.1 N5-carboxyaminoimidazole ribonucleotide mutase [Stratiformator vulcanicus]
MQPNEIERELQRLIAGEITAEDLSARFTHFMELKTSRTSDASIDLDRPRRCGFPEVVFCEGKSAASVVEIFGTLSESGHSAFGTRASTEQAEAVRSRYPSVVENRVARTLRVPAESNTQPEIRGRVAVVTAGTTDLPVAEEAAETLRWMEVGVTTVVDVGVAGPHRLPERLGEIAGADAVVVAAGMEGALPSVVGGHVACPVIAVPTSVGYGASLGGVAALLSMLNSCAANVTVVNIDAGFKAGYIAGLIARKNTA